LVHVCTGTACHINPSAEIFAHLKQPLGIGENETTADGLFTLQTVASMGACSMAPAVAVNDEVHGRMNSQTVDANRNIGLWITSSARDRNIIR